jgi:hypothetical protein
VSGKHRTKGVKREHSVIPGLLPVLERIAAHPSVSAVIPGRITVTHAALTTLELRLGPPTLSGFKLTARRGRTAQEVFVVTAGPQETMRFLRSEVKELVE